MKKSIAYTAWLKITVFILTVITALCSFAACGACAYIIYTNMFYSTEDGIFKDAYSHVAYGDIDILYRRLLLDTPNDEYAKDHFDKINADHFVCTDENGTVLYALGEKTDSPYVYTEQILIEATVDVYKEHTLCLTVSQTPTKSDGYMIAYKLCSALYALRSSIFLCVAVFVFLTLAGAVYLFAVSGRRNGHNGIYKGSFYKIPLEVLLLVIAVLLFIGYYFAKESDIDDVLPLFIPYLFVYLTTGISLFLGLGVTVSARAKAHELIRRTLVYYAFRMTVYVLRSLPLVWKAVIVFAAVALFDAFAFFVSEAFYIPELFLLAFVLSRGVLFIVTVYLFSTLKRLKKGAELIATGAENTYIDTSGMVLDLKEHAETLNSISDGIACEVEKRMKSERLKTELITNVTHDLKTPLTSIISYSDLIAKEKSENERITEYSSVLLRQSERLKKLIDDLLEASKAQTGNLEVNFEAIKADVLIAQALGEYENRFAEKSLTVVLSKPEGDISVTADGDHLWRIFDNLLNNIYKYAMAGTRVYVELQESERTVKITFKNTSAQMLSINAEELTERFTRADNSRSSEGNGLGLSIAKSLTELQGGTLTLTLDGDLFKATLELLK